MFCTYDGEKGMWKMLAHVNADNHFYHQLHMDYASHLRTD